MNGIIVNSCITCGWQKHETPRFNKTCLVCNSKLKGNQRKYCSKTCNSQVYNKKTRDNQWANMKNEVRLKLLTINSSKKAVELAQKMNLI